MGRTHDVPGNAMATAAKYQEFLMAVGKGWIDLTDALERLAEKEIWVDRITMRGDWDGQTDMLIVLAAAGTEGRVVAFHNVEDAITVWKGLAARIRNGSLKWKEDQYANK